MRDEAEIRLQRIRTSQMLEMAQEKQGPIENWEPADIFKNAYMRGVLMGRQQALLWILSQTDDIDEFW